MCKMKHANSLSYSLIQNIIRASSVRKVSQINSPPRHVHAGAPWIFSDLSRSVQMLKREWGAESNGKLPHLFIPSKTATLVPEPAVEDLPLGRTAALWSENFLRKKSWPWINMKHKVAIPVKTRCGFAYRPGPSPNKNPAFRIRPLSRSKTVFGRSNLKIKGTGKRLDLLSSE